MQSWNTSAHLNAAAAWCRRSDAVSSPLGLACAVCDVLTAANYSARVSDYRPEQRQQQSRPAQSVITQQEDVLAPERSAIARSINRPPRGRYFEL